MTDNIFDGLKVIDCASWIAGPAAATILSDFGAEVIKIEPPGAGDPWRASPPVPGQVTDYWWQLTSRNQRRLAIDLTVSRLSRDFNERPETRPPQALQLARITLFQPLAGAVF